MTASNGTPDVETLIVIPARYASTRFPGKPLAMIAGQSMLARVVAQADAAAAAMTKTAYVVATDDERIADHCRDIGAPAVMTAPDLASGSDRALAAADLVAPGCSHIINLQGDAPFTPVAQLSATAQALRAPNTDAATPVIQLTWEALDAFRRAKTTTPHSGTTCIVGADGFAIWFSKSIIPAIRNESRLRDLSPMSPVYRHVGLYGFTRAALTRFTALPASTYEEIEGLEQLRMLEANMRLACVRVPAPAMSTSGVDTPEDLARLEAMIDATGDPGVVP